MAKFLANDPPLCLISFIACLAVCLVGSSVIAGSRPAVNNPNAPPSKYPNRKRDHIHDCVYICTTYSCVRATVFSTWLYVDVTMCDTKDTCSCSLEATAGHCSFHVDLCRCLGSRCVLQPLVGLDCTAQYTPPISNVLNNLWKPNSSWSLSLQLKRKTEKTLKCFFYNLITCWDPCFFTTWALRSRLRFSYVISSNVLWVWRNLQHKKMALGRTIYNMVFRRTSTLFVSILVGAVIFERVFEPNTDILWERINKGVS